VPVVLEITTDARTPLLGPKLPCHLLQHHVIDSTTIRWLVLQFQRHLSHDFQCSYSFTHLSCTNVICVNLMMYYEHWLNYSYSNHVMYSCSSIHVSCVSVIVWTMNSKSEALRNYFLAIATSVVTLVILPMNASSQRRWPRECHILPSLMRMMKRRHWCEAKWRCRK
jgi:hypothetical protein